MDTTLLLVIGVCFAAGYLLVSFVVGFYTRRFAANAPALVPPSEQPPPRDPDEAYYRSILGLSGAFTPEDVRLRYRELAAQYLPSRMNSLNPDLRELAENQMKAIEAAYGYFRRKYGF